MDELINPEERKHINYFFQDALKVLVRTVYDVIVFTVKFIGQALKMAFGMKDPS